MATTTTHGNNSTHNKRRVLAKGFLLALVVALFGGVHLIILYRDVASSFPSSSFSSFIIAGKKGGSFGKEEHKNRFYSSSSLSCLPFSLYFFNGFVCLVVLLNCMYVLLVVLSRCELVSDLLLLCLLQLRVCVTRLFVMFSLVYIYCAFNGMPLGDMGCKLLLLFMEPWLCVLISCIYT